MFPPPFFPNTHTHGYVPFGSPLQRQAFGRSHQAVTLLFPLNLFCMFVVDVISTPVESFAPPAHSALLPIATAVLSSPCETPAGRGTATGHSAMCLDLRPLVGGLCDCNSVTNAQFTQVKLYRCAAEIQIQSWLWRWMCRLTDWLLRKAVGVVVTARRPLGSSLYATGPIPVSILYYRKEKRGRFRQVEPNIHARGR